MDQIVGGLNPMEYRRSLGLFNSGSRLRPHLRITVMCKCLTLFSSPERGGGCAEGTDGGVPLVTIADTDQQKMLGFDKYGT